MTRTRFRRWFAAVALALPLVVVAGCADVGAGAGPAEAGAERAVDTTAEVTLAQAAPPSVFDPHRARVPQFSDPSYLSPVYDQLLQLNDRLQVEPMLASGWETTPDGLSTTLTLRTDVRFQDGSTLDSEVVRLNLERARTLPDSTAANLLADVAGIEAVAPDQVRVTFTGPDHAFPYKLASNIHLSSIISGQALAQNQDLSREPAGSGPYRLVELGQDRATYERDDSYWNQEELPAIRRVTIVAMPDDNARLSALQSGQIDLAPMRPQQSASYMGLVESGAFNLTSFPGQLFGLLINTASPGLDDPRVRRALSMAVDRQTISDALFQGSAPPAYQLLPEGVPGYVAEDDTDIYDPEAARALLAETGRSDLRVRVMSTGTQPSDAIGLIVQAQLAEIGVTLELVPYPITFTQVAWGRGETDAFAVGSVTSGDPTVIIDNAVIGPLNPGGAPQNVQDAIRRAYAVPFDDPQRAAAFEEVTRLLVDEPIHLPVVRVPVQYLSSPDLTGIEHMTFSQNAGIPDVRRLAVLAGGTG